MIQAVIFNKHIYTKRQADSWLKRRNLIRVKPFHETLNYFRARIREPNKYLYNYITHNLHSGIKIIIAIPKV